MSGSTADFGAVKQRQQQTWASGDFSVVATPLMIVGEELCEAVDLGAGRHVLDVACGSGIAALAAARRFAVVKGIDYVPSLLARGRERAAAERLDVEFIEGDAEALPFADASFDVVLSTFGVMFAPNQPRAASELLRVCRSGGKIGLANWTPEGRIGEMFGMMSHFAPPPPGLPSPFQWGTETTLRTLLGEGISDISVTRRTFVLRHLSPAHWVAWFRANFGPVNRTYASLDPNGQAEFAAALLDYATRGNRATDGSMALDAEYLEVVAVRA